MSQKVKRRVNRTKRAKLNSQGFKVYKNFKLYISEGSSGNGWSGRAVKPAPRKELVDMVRDMWNNDPSIKAMRKHIKAISITTVVSQKIAGLWDKEIQKICIKDNQRDSIPFYKSVFIHEIIGHTFWDFARKWRRVELIAFNKLANELPPVSTYVKSDSIKYNWKKINDENDDELTNLNGHDLMTRYVNEQHSAISEIVLGNNGHDTVLNQTDVQRLVSLWKELHY